MGKPSIFSKDYEKKMKMRKARIKVIMLTLFLFGIVAFFYSKGNLSKIYNAVTNIKISSSSKPKENKPVKDEKTTPSDKKPEENKNKIEEGIEVKLSDGKTLKAVYENKDNNKTFKYIEPVEATNYFDISPSKKTMTIFDEKAQKILIVNVNGEVSDITNERYISTLGSVFTKEEMLKSKPDYIWCSMPKFIDDNNIVYISQLPWIGKTTKYLWMVNVGNKSHVFLQGVEGQDIKIGKIEEKGISLTVDGKSYHLDANGNLIQ